MKGNRFSSCSLAVQAVEALKTSLKMCPDNRDVLFGMSYELEGSRAKALEYYTNVLEMENGAGAQFLVKRLLQIPLEPNDLFIGY
ncbi:MAG: hypothetical protein R6V46_10460 [Desulfatiglandaceae bacterium]